MRPLVALLVPWCLLAASWQLERDPFLAAEGYRTTRTEQPIRPKAAAAIRPLGVIYSSEGVKEVLLKIEPEGVCMLKEKEEREVDLLDSRALIRVERIGDDDIMLSINRGRGSRYEIR
jgi:hypothetical protein